MSLKYAVLGLLSQAPMTGFELIREFDVSQSVIWPAPQNEVYRVLRGLTEEGLARPDAAGPRGARTYAITAAGHAEIAAWLAAPSDYTLRYEPMLKAVFLRNADPALRRERARQDGAFFRGQFEILVRTAAARNGPPHPRDDLLYMALGFYRALTAWAEAIAAEA